ncbi:MAG: PIN domain-containing protein [Prochloraceae cyanobacterium]|nr:PIN domain-containing protein [Prochloraceae cyanobacterium]
MAYLVDTNILLRSCQPDHPMYPIAVKAVETLFQQGDKLHIAPQNVVEFWNVSTRPLDKNGLGMTVEQTTAEIARLQGIIAVLPDLPSIHPQWLKLVFDYDVKGVQVHDARLVAFCLVHRLSHILTFNARDFKRYPEITAVHPAMVAP